MSSAFILPLSRTAFLPQKCHPNVGSSQCKKSANTICNLTTRTNPSMSLRTAKLPMNELSRRSALRICALSIAFPLLNSHADSEFSTYRGPLSLGFTFSYPTTWTVKKKPIKTHLSEVIVTSDKDSSTSAGLVVDAVKINTIDQFGSPDEVGNKVVNMEQKKDSVLEATLNRASATEKEGLKYYIIDYSVNSTRGVKRYQAKATITGNQLYVFTMQAKKDTFEGDTEDTFSAMLDSFTVTKQYL